MREKIIEYLKEVDDEIIRCENLLKSYEGTDNYHVVRGRIDALKEVKNDLEGRLEEDFLENSVIEIDNFPELWSRLNFWSNDRGTLNYNGFQKIQSEDLPSQLQRAYQELYKANDGCKLVDYGSQYYIAHITVFNFEFAENNNLTMEELYQKMKEKALNLYKKDLFKDTILLLLKGFGADKHHEVFFLIPAMEEKEKYDKIITEIKDNIYNI